MRRTALIASSLAALVGVAAAGQAFAEPLRLNVRPRSFLDAGKVIQPGAQVNPASAQGQMYSYLISPPYSHNRERFGEGTLPDALGGPFVGAQNPFGPVDYYAPFE